MKKLVTFSILAVLAAGTLTLIILSVAAAPVRGVGLGCRPLTCGLVIVAHIGLLALVAVLIVHVDRVGAFVGRFLGGFTLNVFHLVELGLLLGGIAHGQVLVGRLF